MVNSKLTWTTLSALLLWATVSMAMTTVDHQFTTYVVGDTVVTGGKICVELYAKDIPGPGPSQYDWETWMRELIKAVAEAGEQELAWITHCDIRDLVWIKIPPPWPSSGALVGSLVDAKRGTLATVMISPETWKFSPNEAYCIAVNVVRGGR